MSGIPGSGKTTLAAAVVERVNQLENTNNESAVCIPMDGYLSRAKLATMPDPTIAIHRRGAAFTFDVEAFYELVLALREPITATSPTLHAPSFDHAVKDPVADDIAISPGVRVVVFKGLYISTLTASLGVWPLPLWMNPGSLTWTARSLGPGW